MAGVLNEFILIGSWCVYFYNEYFSNAFTSRMTIRTRDIDFLIDNPAGIKQKVDIPDLLKDLGFIVVYKGDQGYIKLEHPDLILEFLVPEKGKGIDKPCQLSKLGINAQALRFLSLLSDNTINVKVKDFYITLPHPANYALHKLIISQRRTGEEKAEKDRNMAVEILKALVDKGDGQIIKNVFESVPLKWQSKIVKGLEIAEEPGIIRILKE